MVRKLHFTLCTYEIDSNNFEKKQINMIQRDEHKAEVHGKWYLCGAGFQYTTPALFDCSTLSLNSTGCTRTCLCRNNMRCHLLCKKSFRLIQVITLPDNKEKYISRHKSLAFRKLLFHVNKTAYKLYFDRSFEA